MWASAAILIVTFPFVGFTTHSHWRRVAWIPFAMGIVRPVDLLLNMCLYAPWGFLFPASGGARRVGAAMACAFVLSSALEITQVWSHTRFPSATDVLMNVVGAGVGAWVASRTTNPVRDDLK